VPKDYIFPSDTKVEVFVNKENNITITESDWYDEVHDVVISRQRLPQLIAWLQEIQADLDAGAYDEEDPEKTPT